MVGTKNTPLSVFVSYSHKDEDIKNELLEHLSLLKRENLIREWNDRYILAGEEWNEEINENLKNAQIILLLVSSSFISSEFCWHREMVESLKRHNSKEAFIIPIIVRPCDWKSAPFGKIQALPKDAKAVTTWVNKDEAYLNIAEGIRERIRFLVLEGNKSRQEQKDINKAFSGTSSQYNSSNNTYLQVLKREYGLEWLNGALTSTPSKLNFMTNYPKKLEKLPRNGDVFFISISDEGNNLISQLHGIVDSCSTSKPINEIISESEGGLAHFGFSSKKEFYSYMGKQRFPSDKVFCVTLKDIEYKKMVVRKTGSKLIDLKHGLYILDEGYDTIIVNDHILFENFNDVYNEMTSLGKQSRQERVELKRMELF